MAIAQKDSIVKSFIKNLCRSYGWSYGVFWSFDQSNSILLTMQDAYFEEEIQGLIDDLLLQSPILGKGLIGQAAFTKKHLWMSSEDNFIPQNSSGSIWDMFQDNSNFCRQFSLGIKTITAIPVEQQGVLEFGSTSKIVENSNFINQTKTMFDEIVNGDLPSQNSNFGSTAHYSINQTSFDFPPQSQSMFLDYKNNQTFFNDPHQDMFDFDLPTDFGLGDEFFQSGDLQSIVTVNDQFSLQSPPVSFNEKVKPLTFSGTYVDKFGNTGDLGDIVMPAVNDNRLGFESFDSFNSTRSTGNDSCNLPPKNGLFSNLGIKELLEGVSGTSTSCIEDQVSSGSKRRKTDDSIWEMGCSQPVVYGKNLVEKSEPIFKSGAWLGEGCSMDGSSTILQAKKRAEPTKPTKKKAKPGTRPRPKDRQMILDRMAELRELIPNGGKMSIDCLLDRTIKHMLFLQSVTKHADRIKHLDEPKYNGVVQNNHSNDPNNSGVTWACELGNQTMICPLIVEDLSTPGQMLIEMISEEDENFLEIVDVIRGFGLTILKGVMESREEKIWARFIVEAEGKRHVTRHEIFASLVQLLQTMGSKDNRVDKKTMQTGNFPLNEFHRSGIQVPVSLGDTVFGMDL